MLLFISCLVGWVPNRFRRNLIQDCVAKRSQSMCEDYSMSGTGTVASIHMKLSLARLACNCVHGIIIENFLYETNFCYPYASMLLAQSNQIFQEHANSVVAVLWYGWCLFDTYTHLCGILWLQWDSCIVGCVRNFQAINIIIYIYQKPKPLSFWFWFISNTDLNLVSLNG